MAVKQIEGGVIERRSVPSASEPGKRYSMVMGPRMRWSHEDEGCRAWHINGRCRHVDELNSEERGKMQVVPAGERGMAVFEEMETMAIMEAVEGRISPTWIYVIPGVGENLSVVGVENAAREMAIRREPIREVACTLTYEDDDEARFVAHAARYAIAEDGREVLLDTAIRAKRVSKWITVTSDNVARKHGIKVGEKIPNEHWFEVGMTKASRNAKLALMPDEVRQHIIRTAKGGAAPDKPAPKASQPRQRKTKPTEPTGTPMDDRQAFTAWCLENGLTKPGVVEKRLGLPAGGDDPVGKRWIDPLNAMGYTTGEALDLAREALTAVIAEATRLHGEGEAQPWAKAIDTIGPLGYRDRAIAERTPAATPADEAPPEGEAAE